MQARVVGAGRGLHWLAEGWRLFRAAPLGWLALVFTYWLMMTLISLAPYVGVAAASVLVPAFSVGFMAAARAASHGGGVQLALLFDGFRQAPAAQLALGVVYFACLGLVLAASALADDGALARWMLTGGRPGDEVPQSDAFVMALGCAAALYTPVMMMFWFAPPLAAWHSVGAVKALFFSFFGCLMNWRAFLAYAAATALFTLVLPFFVLLIARSVAGGLPAMSLIFPLLAVLLPTLFASFYVSYRDVFGGGNEKV